MLQKIIDAWRARRKRREWTVERQLEELRVLVQVDHRWLAHDPIANALTGRYLKALNEHWYKVSTEDVRNLRERLGLCPHQRAASAPQPNDPRPPAAQEGKTVACACGDEFPIESYGAGFLDAKGMCFGCDAAETANHPTGD